MILRIYDNMYLYTSLTITYVCIMYTPNKRRKSIGQWQTPITLPTYVPIHYGYLFID